MPPAPAPLAARLLFALGELELAARRGLKRLTRGRLGVRPRGAQPVWVSLPTDGGEPRAPWLFLPAVAWSYRFQRPQQLARALAVRGRPVVYCDAFRRAHLAPRRHHRTLAPAIEELALAFAGRPDPYRALLGREEAPEVAAAIVAALPERPRALLVQLPFWRELALALRARTGAPLVYDRIDLHAGFAGVPEASGEAERRLVGEADLVVASSHDLAARSRQAARRLERLPNAVAIDDFALAPPRPVGERRRIGYVGALAEWFDAEAVAAAAHARPDLQFELAGAVEERAVAALARFANVRFSGEIDYARVPAFLARVDAALVPFVDGPLARAVDPVKLYEAFAVGLPVVGRALPEIVRWAPHAVTYDAPDGLAAALAGALASDSPERRQARRAALSGETWAARAAALEALVDRLVE